MFLHLVAECPCPWKETDNSMLISTIVEVIERALNS